MDPAPMQHEQAQEARIKEPTAAAGTLQAVTEPFVSLQPLNCTALDHRALMFCIFRNETLVEQT